MLSLIAKSCTANSWSLLVREHVLIINTKMAKINGYAPSQIKLGFKPQQYHFDIKSAAIPNLDEVEYELPSHQYQIFMALRDENRLLASDNVWLQQNQRTQTAFTRTTLEGQFASLLSQFIRGWVLPTSSIASPNQIISAIFQNVRYSKHAAARPTFLYSRYWCHLAFSSPDLVLGLVRVSRNKRKSWSIIIWINMLIVIV